MKNKEPIKFHGYIMSVGADMPEDAHLALHIGRVPGRKRLCVYASESNRWTASITVLGFCKNEKSAENLQKILDWFILKKEPKELL